MLSQPQVECPVKHHFADGVYTRETFMPKGTIAVGKRHKYKTTNILLKGKITVLNGSETPEVLEAPCIFISEAGVKKAAYFHEDTIWLNVHNTTSTDIEEIEKEFITEDTYGLGSNSNSRLSGSGCD